MSNRAGDVGHAIDFFRKGHWDLEFAARWLGVTQHEFEILLKVHLAPTPPQHKQSGKENEG